jgi:hypothetical protein
VFETRIACYIFEPARQFGAPKKTSNRAAILTQQGFCPGCPSNRRTWRSHMPAGSARDPRLPLHLNRCLFQLPLSPVQSLFSSDLVDTLTQYQIKFFHIQNSTWIYSTRPRIWQRARRAPLPPTPPVVMVPRGQFFH